MENKIRTLHVNLPDTDNYPINSSNCILSQNIASWSPIALGDIEK